MADERLILVALQKFADSVTRKMTAMASGEPENQLRAPFENLIQDVGKSLGLKVVAKGESKLPDRLGKPDYAILSAKLLAGFTELKAPGFGARPERFRGHKADGKDTLGKRMIDVSQEVSSPPAGNLLGQ